MFNWSSLWLRAARGPPTSDGRIILAALTWAWRKAAPSHTNLHWCSTNRKQYEFRANGIGCRAGYTKPDEPTLVFNYALCRSQPTLIRLTQAAGLMQPAANDQPFFFRRESARNIGKNSGAFKMISALSTVLMPSKCSCSSSRSIAENNLGQNFFMAFKAT